RIESTRSGPIDLNLRAVGRALSPAGHRRQSGTCREVKRRLLLAVLIPASRRLTSRQDPDRASPARPRREHTPRGPAWAAPGPSPRGPVDAETHITIMRPPRFRSPFEGSCGPVAPDEGYCTVSRAIVSTIPTLENTREFRRRPRISFPARAAYAAFVGGCI